MVTLDQVSLPNGGLFLFALGKEEIGKEAKSSYELRERKIATKTQRQKEARRFEK